MKAVVIGGSIAGLMTAAQLSRHADEVLVMERDTPDGAQARKAVPQGRQPHVLLARGYRAMSELFPGVGESMVSSGATFIADLGQELNVWTHGSRVRPAPSGLTAVCATRPFIEAALRSRTVAIPNVTLYQAEVTALTMTDGRVDGVVTSGAGAGTDDRVGADIVVDCTGRSSRLDAWLGALGFSPPPTREVRVHLGYASRMFTRAPGQTLDGSLWILSLGPAPAARFSVAVPVEGDRWHVLVSGRGDDRPGADPADHSKRLLEDQAEPLHYFARDGEPLDEVTTYRFASNVRRDFHRLSRFPRGLYAAGDSVASYNPVYGQGMTAAALHAGALGAHLEANGRDATPAAYFRRVKKVTDGIWRSSVLADFAASATEGRRPLGTGLLLRYNDRFIRAGHTDGELYRRFLSVVELEAGPESLLALAALLRVARGGRPRRA